jgi:hypothetical protein
MEVTKWLKPLLGHRSQAVPECPLNKYELDVHQHLVNISYWPVVPDQELHISGIFCVRERQLLAGSYRTD